jgi:cytoskeleton protein RodZ
MMENVTETYAGQEDIAAGFPPASLGTMLREAREHLGLTVMDVSSQIKFAPRQIEALEADDFQHLPETAFLRGFVRSYAKVVHLDAEALLATLPQNKAIAAELTQNSVEEPFPDVHSVLRQNLVWLGAALMVILIAAGFSLWHFSSPSEPMKPAQVESPVTLPAETPVSSTPPVQETAAAKTELPKEQPPKTQKAQPPKAQTPKAQSPKAQSTATVAQSSVPAAKAASPAKKEAVTTDTQPGALTPITSLRLEFSEDSWAEIKDKDDKILSSRAHPAGTELTVKGRAPFLVLIGRASSVKLYYRGKEVDLVPHTRRSTDVARITLE